MDRQVEVYHPPKLVLKEGDEYLVDVDMVLAQCYYCHDSYIPVPASEYARFVVYNCGCHKEPMSGEDKFMVVVIAIGLVAATWPIWRIAWTSITQR